MSFLRECKSIWIPLVGIMIVGPTLVVSGHPTAGWIVGQLGTAIVLLLNVLWIIVFDPRHKYRSPAQQKRLNNYFTFRH